MPPGGAPLTEAEGLLTRAETRRLVALLARHGASKVRLTGGEPALRPDLEAIAADVAGTPGVAAVGLTTNGVGLARRVAGLKAAGVSLLNVSLDTLDPDRFEAITRRRGHASVLATLAAARAAGLGPVKLNVVAMAGVNDDEVPGFVAYALRAGVNVRFIEYMPFDGNAWARARVVPYRAMLAAAQAATPGGLVRADAPGEGDPGAVAKDWVPADPARARAAPGAAVSFVTSMTDAFCSTCTRVRLLADGAFKVCLFGGAEVSLRDALRGGASDADLAALVAGALRGKAKAHAGLDVLGGLPNRAMVRIGG
jgi:cyclic pyranopterin phosphate synthase